MLTVTLYALSAAVFALGLLTTERFLYYRYRQAHDIAADLERRPMRDVRSRRCQRALHVWQLLRYRRRARQFTWILSALVSICPLLGLLGTTSGMIDVFDALATTRGGLDLAIALSLSTAHIAYAIVPTLASVTATIAAAVCLWLMRRRIADGECALQGTLQAQLTESPS